MVALNNKRIIRNLIIVMLCMIMILGIVLLIIMRVHYSNEDVAELRYINSDRVKGDYLMIPYNINMVYSAYSGDVSQVTIEKSIYYFANEVIPKYRKMFSLGSNEEVESYFEHNKFSVGVDTGIDNIDEFKKIIGGICLLDNNLSIVTYELSDQKPSLTSENLITKLFIKYKNNKRIIFKVKVSKEVLKNISSIKYSFEKIED